MGQHSTEWDKIDTVIYTLHYYEMISVYAHIYNYLEVYQYLPPVNNWTCKSLIITFSQYSYQRNHWVMSSDKSEIYLYTL